MEQLYISMYFSTHTIRPWPNKKLRKAATILCFLFGQAESYGYLSEKQPIHIVENRVWFIGRIWEVRNEAKSSPTHREERKTHNYVCFIWCGLHTKLCSKPLKNYLKFVLHTFLLVNRLDRFYGGFMRWEKRLSLV
jgi:hypothetical protein